MSGLQSIGTDIIGAFDAGRERREKSRLAAIGEKSRQLQGEVLGGNTSRLGELYKTDPEAGMRTQQFTDKQKAAELQKWTSMAYAADTPEKWSQFIATATAQGRQFDPGEDAFENRPQFLAQGLSVAEQRGWDMQDRTFNASQRNADRSYGLDRERLGIEREKMAQPDKPPSSVQEYEYAKSQGFAGSLQDWELAKKGDGISVESPDGTVMRVGGKGGKAPTEGQSKDMGYLTRMSGTLPLIDKYGDALTSLGESVGGEIPGVGNYVKSEKYQLAEQAGNDWLTALLRKESGATVPPAELASYSKIYLPLPGDKAGNLAQKKAARARATLGVKMGLPAHLILQMEMRGADLSQINAEQTQINDSTKGNVGRTKSGVTFEVQP